MNTNEQRIPVHLLSGFLGSGKTTLLQQLLEHYTAQGLKPAVIMNELGDVNLDGELLDGEVPMAEMLGGCICCTIRGDLGMEISMLIDEHKPDVIIIESTGAANPMETIDGVTEAAMYKKIDLRTIITVVDGPVLLARSRDGKGRTLKLMKEQIRCATQLLLNKADKLEPEQLVEAQQQLRELNAHAPILATVRCMLDDWGFLEQKPPVVDFSQDVLIEQPQSYSDVTQDVLNEQPQPQVAFSQDIRIESAQPQTDLSRDLPPSQEGHVCSAACTHDHHVEQADSHQQDAVSKPFNVISTHHHTHEHVMAYTHYWSSPVDSTEFEALLQRLPDNIYRAKGIVTFTDTPSRFLFQYAYRESDFMRIEPQGHVNDVAVFIGEHFNKDWLLNELALLEQSEQAEA